MQKSLYALIELQEVDNRLDELMEERGDLPGIVEELEEKLSQKKAKFSNIDQEIKNSKVQIKELENKITEATEKLAKYNDQLYQVKTNREYDAITNEIEAVRLEQQENEEAAAKLSESLEDLVAAQGEFESEISKIEEELSENKVELDARLAETAEEENELKKERESIIKKFKPNILSSYETIRNARDGKGIAPVVNGNCGGCYSYIPPQKIVEIRKMSKIYECEFCGRILVWNEKI
ncbi:MAG: hypothetical protein H6627_01265 [Calditrichae bacterium]|nr:hypothetical protein [Calditrichota bacterium]MCB9057166.1 hypothetical protein [Calditrichia bacterium]